MATMMLAPPRGLVDLGPDRVVVVARVGRVDGDEGNVAEVGAVAAGEGLQAFALRQHALGE